MDFFLFVAWTMRKQINAASIIKQTIFILQPSSWQSERLRNSSYHDPLSSEHENINFYMQMPWFINKPLANVIPKCKLYQYYTVSLLQRQMKHVSKRILDDTKFNLQLADSQNMKV